MMKTFIKEYQDNNGTFPVLRKKGLKTSQNLVCKAHMYVFTLSATLIMPLHLKIEIAEASHFLKHVSDPLRRDGLNRRIEPGGQIGGKYLTDSGIFQDENVGFQKAFGIGKWKPKKEMPLKNMQ